MKKYIILIFCLGILGFQTGYGQDTSTNNSEYTTYVYGVCGMCKETIEGAANSVKGVKSAVWDMETGILTAEISSSFDESRLHKAIVKVGYDTALMKAEDDDYNSLHVCCKYRDPEVMADHGDFDDIHTIGVSGNCDMCKENIENAALSLPTVQYATYSIANQELYVQSIGDFNIVELHQKVAAAGYDTDQLIADANAYAELPNCCQYRDPEAHKLHMDERGTTVSGTVYQDTPTGRKPLDLAEVTTLDGEYFAITDNDGNFELELPEPTMEIIISYIGFTPDTILVSRGTEIDAVLSDIKNLKEIVVTYRKKTSGVSSLSTIMTYQIDEAELLKAACCNLAESFETLPAVDVATTDAVTGTRQIKMLGLAGPNISYTQENVPILTGLSSIQGLTLIPGTWIAGMQLNQSIGSVSNGYESVSGQINVQLQNSETMDPVFLNLFANESGRFEGNAHLGHRFSEKLGTALLLHGNLRTRELDRNNDGFMDSNTGDGFSVVNRWDYNSFKNIVLHGGIKYAQMTNKAGQLSTLDVPELWKANTDIDNFNVWVKGGYVSSGNKHQSIAIKMNYDNYNQLSEFGKRVYSGKQDRLHGQLLYQNIIGTTDHDIIAGVGVNYRNSAETLEIMNYNIEELVPHAFAEYTYKYRDIFSAVIGARYDQHNLYGGFFTPRLHMRYNLDNGVTFRFSAGQARRTASILAENFSVLASGRSFSIAGDDSSTPYGLPIIQSNNFSLGAIYNWDLFGEESSLSVDYFFTHFDKNVIVDFDKDINALNIYNQKDKSRGHNVQVQWDFRPMERFDIRLAYKWQLLELGYVDGLREAPFTPNHRAFLNMAYSTRNKWTFDGTFNLIGAQRIPDTYMLPEAMQMDERAPAYVRINAQISKEIFDGFLAYVGVENLTGYQQEYAIINAQNPFSDSFDASLIWGPTMGRDIYAGIRYTIVKRKK